MRTILFLYTRLPDYFYQCLRFFANRYRYQVIVVRHSEDENARYSFDPDTNIKLLYKEEVDIKTLIRQTSPVAIVLSGWSDKSYTSSAGAYKASIPVILAMDNPWRGDLRQFILTRMAAITIRRVFNKVWVTGSSQYEYALRLGFSKKDIVHHLYSADCAKFYAESKDASFIKTLNYPHTLVYVGRMVEYKQPHILAQAFHELASQSDQGWKLIMAGEGPMKQTIRDRHYKCVEIVDFVKPSDLARFYSQAGIFVLPSIGEHWGVAVHEAAAAGLPLLLSDTVEAASQFLIHGFNGYKFSTGNGESLKHHLSRLMAMPDSALYEMGQNSMTLSKTISHETWAANLNSILIDRQ